LEEGRKRLDDGKQKKINAGRKGGGKEERG
jgi:hypothetical protein